MKWPYYIECFVVSPEKAKKSLSQRDDQIKGQKDEIKQLKHKLTVQERITNSSESSNKKYLSALVQSQGLIKSLVTTVTTALGDMADITDGEEDDKKTVKKEKKEEETTEWSIYIFTLFPHFSVQSFIIE